MQRPSILFINRVYPPSSGATGRLLRELARSLAREGWRVTVVTTGDRNIRQRDGSVRIVRTKINGQPRTIFEYSRVLMKLARLAVKQDPHHIVVSMTDPPLAILAGRYAAKRLKARHIHWCQDMYPHLLPALGKAVPEFLMARAKQMVRKALASCDRIIVIGRCMAKTLSSEGGNPAQMTFIPNWPNFELVAADWPEAKFITEDELIEKSDVTIRPHHQQVKGQRPFRVLYAGSIGMAHPLESILNLAQKAQQAALPVEFVFVGEGAGHEALARKRAQLGLNNIRQLPFQPAARLKQVMESGDVHLISMEEAAAGLLVPSKFYSALAVARPCLFIGPQACEVSKVIDEFGAGFHCRQGEDEALFAALKRYVEDAQCWISAQEGAQKAGRIFVPRESIKAWIERAWRVCEADIQDANPAKQQGASL